jgi:hypothetical protein
VVSLLSFIAITTLKERFTPPVESAKSVLLDVEDRFAFLADERTLMAKEWLELRRSGSLGPVITGFIGPLFGIYILLWIVETGMGLEIGINLVMYGGLIGFFSMMTYSWLNNVESNEFLNVQPVGVDRLIGVKFRLYLLLTLTVASAYLVIIAAAGGELALLPLALLVSACTTVYVGAVTANMTGLRTNSMLFDGHVLGRFFGSVVPPLMIVMFASFAMEADFAAAALLQVALSLALLGAAARLLKVIPGKWRTDTFGF